MLRTRAKTRSWLLRYGVAVLTVEGTIALLSIPVIGPGLASVVFLAVLISAWYGGVGPGLATTGLMIVAAVAIRGAYYGAPFPPAQIVGLILFAAGGVLISFLIEALHAARRKAEGSQRWLSAVLSSIGDAVIATDDQGRIAFTNSVARGLTGWGQDEATGEPLDRVFCAISEETRELLEPPVVRALRDETMVRSTNSTLLIARDGIERPIADIAAPIKDDEGQVHGVVLVFRDIAEQRRWEEDLRRSEEHRRIMIEQVKEYAIFTMDPNGRATSWNGGVERVLGFGEDEFLGQPLTRTFPTDEDPAEEAARELRIAAARGQISNDRWQVKKDGTRFWASGITTAVRDRGGKLIGFTKVVRDLTEQWRAQHERAELLAREQAARAEAEAANQAKDRFLATLSHELRTPLTPVLMTVADLLEHPGVPPEIRPTLELTRRHVELEARLIDDLIDITQIVRGRLDLKREPVDVHDLVRRALDTACEEIRARGLELTLDLSAAQSHVNGDAARLQQVCWNLIANAAKFTPQGGTVAVRTRNANGRRLHIEVTDSGVGIAPEALLRIFDAFEQGEASAWTRRAGGLGLGLAISKSIVEAHGGRLTAASEGPTRGAVFTVDLAVAVAAESQASSELPGSDDELPLRRELTILLVEDDEATLRVMERLLAQRGYAVKTARSVAEGLSVAACEPFDLIVSDLGLPDGNGLELMRRLRSQRAVAGIAVSGFGREEDKKKTKEAGFAAHLTKPVDIQTLDAVIQQVAP